MLCVRCWLSAALMIVVLSAGCGRDESEAPATEQSSGDASQSDDTAAAAPEETPAPESTSADPAAPAPTGPMRDVAVVPSVDGEPMKTAIVFYTAKDDAAPIAAFHKKDLESKGWKIARNDAMKMPGTTLNGAIQQYEKGSDVITVVVAEQVAEGKLAMVGVMDFPLPPKTQYVVAYGGQANGETLDPAADVIAWMTKDLAARGWTADAPKESGGTHSVNFRKGQRTLAAQFRASGGTKQGCSFYFMHMG